MPQWEEGRYVSLLGDPIGADGKPEPLHTSFYKAADFKTAGVAAVLSAMLNTAMQASPEMAALTAVVGNVMGLTFFRFCERGARYIAGAGFTVDDIDTKCIDIRPDRNTLPTLNRYGIPAHISKSAYGAVTLLGLLNDTLHIAGSFNAMATLDSRISIDSSMFMRGLNGYSLFDKVVSGEYVIVDMPKPKPVEEKVGALSFAGMQA